MRLKIPDTVSPERVREILDDTKKQRADRYFAIHDSWLRSVIDGGRWCLGPVVQTRDSDALTKVNHEALVEALEEHKVPESTYVFRDFNHAGCGWLTRMCFMVVTAKGTPTKVCRFMEAWNEALENYPCADDDKLSEMERAELVEYLKDEYGTWTSEKRRPEDYIEVICEKFSLSNMEDLKQYGYMDRPRLGAKGVVQDQVEKFMFEQGWLDCDECNGSGMVPLDRLGPYLDVYPEDEVFPGFMACCCDAFDFWDFDENGDPVLKDVQTCEEPTPLFDWLLYPDNPGALIPTPPWVPCPV